MNGKSRRRKVALFVDTANCRNVDFEQVLRIVQRHGELVVAQAYGNFSNYSYLGKTVEKLFLLGVRLIHCPAWRTSSGQLKSAADEMLMNDIRTLMQTQRDVTRFIICSGDGHYIPTICEIKKWGKEVIVMADHDGTSRLVKEAADKFIPLPPVAVPVPREVFQGLVKAVRVVQRAQSRSAVPCGNIKTKMTELLQEFDEKKYRSRRGRPFRQFSEFLREAQSEGWVRLIRQDGAILVTTPLDQPQVA